MNIRTFIEYERSFGRGVAFDVTHASVLRTGLHPREIAAQYNLTEAQIKEVVDDYAPLAGEVNEVLGSEDVARVEEFEKKVKAFRTKYPWLYSDVTERKTFRIRTDGEDKV